MSESPWAFLAMSDYQAPGLYSASAARLRLHTLKHWLVNQWQTQSPAPIKQESELRPLSAETLQHWVRPIDWQPGIDALDQVLEPWWQSKPGSAAVQWLVSPPGSRLAELVNAWAGYHQLTLCTAPAPEQLLNGHDAQKELWPDPHQPWVILHLEHYYLRHLHGLALIRSLLNRAMRGDLGLGVILLDSWALTFLRQLGVYLPDNPWTLQPFDGQGLARAFLDWVAPEQRSSWVCRHAASGKVVLSQAMLDEAQISAELKQLAVYCRGNLGLARTYWRARLKAEPEPEQDTDSEHYQASVWLGDMPEPVMLPSTLAHDTALILHVLLLHNGLPDGVLPELLPMPAYGIDARLAELAALGVVELCDTRWRIAEQAYIAVREYLRGRDFVTDDF
ncbi:MAG: hypothetical protein RQ715_09965 [Methylococcales bacterium]|nr:hypothetical protein [Methylococcales bacterium]